MSDIVSRLNTIRAGRVMDLSAAVALAQIFSEFAAANGVYLSYSVEESNGVRLPESGSREFRIRYPATDAGERVIDLNPCFCTGASYRGESQFVETEFMSQLDEEMSTLRKSDGLPPQLAIQWRKWSGQEPAFIPR